MKFVVFKMPIEAWDGYDWLYNLMEDKNSEYYDFYLVEARKPDKARELVAKEIFEKNIREYGLECVIETVYQSFCDLEPEKDEDIFEVLGEKDGSHVLKLYEKYGWETFYDDKVDFYKTLTKEERNIFLTFDMVNIEKLYKKRIWYDLLVMPITKTLK